MRSFLKSKRPVVLLALLSLSGLAQANAATTYVLTITNGGTMPVSPMVIYTQNGGVPQASVGSAPTSGFVQLCQTGNPMTRIQELAMNSNVTFTTQTTGLLFPGESRVVEVDVKDPPEQSIQFETMYGKTKDVCALGSVLSHSLYALKQHVGMSVVGKDTAVITGAFLDPSIPMGQTYLDSRVCNGVPDAVTCLRNLSLPHGGLKKIRFFSGYLSSLNMLLESKYGADQAQSLAVPTSGALQFELKLKH